MLETSARLLRLLSLLQIPRAWTGADLADRLEVTTRTLRNDVERLRLLGYPVHGTRGTAGGYRLGVGANLPPLLLDDEEAVAVTVGLRTAADGGIAGVDDSAMRALAKIERILPNHIRRRVAALHENTDVVPGDEVGPRVDGEVLSVIAAACRDHERLRFDYLDHDQNATRRSVEPYRLVNWGWRWYLVAYDLERDDWRTLRVDRLVPRMPSGPRFAPRRMPKDLVDRVTNGVSAAAWRFVASVTVHAAADFVSARIPPVAGTVEAIDDATCLFHTGADSAEALAVNIGRIAVHGLDFTVTEPPELVALLREQGSRYLRSVGADASASGSHRG